MIYFDNAATTLQKPSCVVQAVAEAMCSLGNSGRGVHRGALSASRVIYDTRAALAQLFGAESPERTLLYMIICMGFLTTKPFMYFIRSFAE